MVGSFSCENAFRNANSLAVDPASGGGGTRKSLPEEIAQVFQEPAFGSICPTPSWARALRTSTRTRNMRGVVSLLINFSSPDVSLLFRCDPGNSFISVHN